MIILETAIGNIVTIDNVRYQNVVVSLIVDSEADLPAQNALGDNQIIVAPSKCHCTQESTDWQMDSTGAWYKQKSTQDVNATVQLDMTNYYTAAQVEQAITDGIRAFIVGDDIPANYDLNDFITVGHRNCAAANANSCQNRPLGSNQTGGFGVTNTLVYTTSGTTDKVKQEVVYNVTGNNLARNRTFWRYYSSAGWSDWYEVTTTVVVIQQNNTLQQPSLLMGTQSDTE